MLHLALLLAAFAAQHWLRAGPMIGHVEPERAFVWLRVNEGTKLAVDAHCEGKSVSLAAEKSLGRGCRILVFEHLEPASKLYLRVGAGGGGEAILRVPIPPQPMAEGVVRIAFGSCSQDARWPSVPVYRAMARAKPDLALFLGDNSYFVVGSGKRPWSTSGPTGDWSSPERMFARHMQTRTNADLQALLRTTPCYAIWDDHDYGPNNAGADFALKNEALRVFKQVWANPYYGTPTTPGVFSRFRRGPVEVFLMDDRFYKRVDRPDARIWGAAQLQWLMDGLRASSAPVKVIANGTQFLSREARGEGHWREARGEYERLLRFIDDEGITGIVLLSGDRHFSELMLLEREGKPPIYEFTSSPFQQSRRRGPVESHNPLRIWATGGNSFGLLTVSVPGTLRFDCLDDEGLIKSHTVPGTFVR